MVQIKIAVKPVLADLVPMFLENRRLDLSRIADALRSSDWKTVRIAGHNMAGTGSSYGFTAITDIGRSLEAAALAGDPQEIGKGLAALETYLEQVEVIHE